MRAEARSSAQARPCHASATVARTTSIGPVRAAEHEVAVRLQAALVAADQPAERALVAGARRGEQVMVIGDVGARASMALPTDDGGRATSSMRSAPGVRQTGHEHELTHTLGAHPDRGRIADGGARHARRLDRPEHDPARSGSVDRAARMDGQRLQPELRGAAHDGRRARRPLRPPQPVRRRPRALRGGVGRLRARAHRGLADRRAGGPGCGLGAHRAARTARF